MKPCCDKYVQNCQPKAPKNSEYFDEIQTCSCGQRLRIRFQRVEFLGGKVEYVPLSADPI